MLSTSAPLNRRRLLRLGTLGKSPHRARSWDRRLHDGDRVATIYHALGVPTTFEFRDALSRPYSLVPWGQPIMELLA